MFKFYEVPGGNMSFSCRFWPGDPVRDFTFQDGEVYEIPIGVARHLNNNGWYPTYKWANDSDGIPRQVISQKERRFGFSSLEFADIGDVPDKGKQLITVQDAPVY
jgi:hypothetical protein